MLSTLQAKVNQYFSLEDRGTNIWTEARSAAVGFLTVAYILSVNAAILADSGGTCEDPFGSDGQLTDDYLACQSGLKTDLIYATAISSCIATLTMGLWANLPLILCPGLGLNAYFAYTVVGFAGTGSVTYGTALFAIFMEGIIFLVLSLTGFRTKLLQYIPSHIRLALPVGIGLFLANIGLQSSLGIGIVSPKTATTVGLGGCGHYNETIQFVEGFGDLKFCSSGTLTGATTWLGIAGFLIMSLLLIAKVKGSIFLSIFIVTLFSWFRKTPFTYFPDTVDGNGRFEVFKRVISLPRMRSTLFALFRNLQFDNVQILIALLSFLYVDILDTTGTLFSMTDFAGLLTDEGRIPNQTAAFSSDAIGTIVGSLLGTSTVTTYLESSAAIEEGGRTGLTSVFVSLFFLLSLFFAPIFASVPPWATGAALIVIGALMMKNAARIKWEDPKIAIPSFITIILMPLTFSVAYGIIGGIFVNLLFALFSYSMNLFGLKASSFSEKIIKAKHTEMTKEFSELYDT